MLVTWWYTACNHSVYTVCTQWLHPLLASLRMLSAYFLLYSTIGFETPFFYKLQLQFLVILNHFTNWKLYLSGLVLMTYVGYMTIHNIHVSQLRALLSPGCPLVPCCPDKRGFTVCRSEPEEVGSW